MPKSAKPSKLPPSRYRPSRVSATASADSLPVPRRAASSGLPAPALREPRVRTGRASTSDRAHRVAGSRVRRASSRCCVACAGSVRALLRRCDGSCLYGTACPPWCPNGNRSLTMLTRPTFARPVWYRPPRLAFRERDQGRCLILTGPALDAQRRRVNSSCVCRFRRVAGSTPARSTNVSASGADSTRSSRPQHREQRR